MPTVLTMDPAVGLYVSLFLAPFVQEDAAVVGAASAASMKAGAPELLFASVLAGLVISDVWKYWAGRAARTQGWARRFIEKPAVSFARERVVKHLGLTLLAARFVPGTRIPLYVASGLFGAPFGKFLFFVVSSGVLYIGLMFGLFALLGVVAGDRAMALTPFVALGVVLTMLGVAIWRARAAKPR